MSQLTCESILIPAFCNSVATRFAASLNSALAAMRNICMVDGGFPAMISTPTIHVSRNHHWCRPSRHTFVLEQFCKVCQCTQCFWLVCKLLEYGCILDIRDERVRVFCRIRSWRERKIPAKVIWRVWADYSQMYRFEARQKRSRRKHFLSSVRAVAGVW